MKKLNLILHSKYFCILLLFGTLFYLVISFSSVKSCYQGSETYFSGNILSVKENLYGITLEVQAKEKLLVYYKGEETFEIGDQVLFTGTLEKPNENRNFNLFNYRTYLKGKQIFWIVSTTEMRLKRKHTGFYSIKNKIMKRIEKSPNSSYFYAFLLGDSSQLEYKNTYQDLGISHLFAVSGMHILFIAGILTNLFQKLFHKKMVSFLITIFVLTFYVWLLSDSPSANRAYFLYILTFLNKHYRWNFKSLELLLFVFVISVVRNPFCILQTGFQFSFLICFFLMLNKKDNNASYFKSLFSTSFLAFLVSLPLSMYSFHQIHLGSVLFNMVAVPFVSMILFPLSFLCFFLPVLEGVFSFSLQLFHFLIRFLTIFDFLKFPMMSFPLSVLVIYYVVLILWMVHSKRWKIVFFSFLLIHFFCPYLNPYYTIDMIDVGQGDATLIRFPHLKETILVDCGGIENQDQVDNILIPYLKALGVRKIDTLILTHGDYDHMGNASTLISKIKVGKVFMNQGNDNELETLFLKQAKKIPIYQIDQETISLNGITFQFLNSKNSTNENEDSLIFYTKLNGKNILFMGDAGEMTEKELLEEYNLPKMDILKVGHHGSKNSSNEIFLQIVHPRIALISAGVNNRYSHPHQETIQKLEQLDSNILSTNTFGSIRLILKNDVHTVTRFSSGTLPR